MNDAQFYSFTGDGTFFRILTAGNKTAIH